MRCDVVFLTRRDEKRNFACHSIFFGEITRTWVGSKLIVTEIMTLRSTGRHAGFIPLIGSARYAAQIADRNLLPFAASEAGNVVNSAQL